MGAMQQMLLGGAGLSVNLSSYSITQTNIHPTVTSPSVTATPAGGSGTYTYLWSVINDTGTIATTINSPTLATSTFKISGAAALDQGVCDVRCQVTDTVTGLVARSPLCHCVLNAT